MKKFAIILLSLVGMNALAMEKTPSPESIEKTIQEGSPEELNKILPQIDRANGYRYLTAAVSSFAPKWSKNRVKNLQLLLDAKIGFDQEDWAKTVLGILGRKKERASVQLAHIGSSSSPAAGQFTPSYATEQREMEEFKSALTSQQDQLRFIDKAIELVKAASTPQ